MLVGLKNMGDLPGLFYIFLQLEIPDIRLWSARVQRHADVFVQGPYLWPQVKIVQEAVLFIANIDEGCVKARHDLSYPAEIYITDGVIIINFFFVKFDKEFILQQSNIHLILERINDQFLFHDNMVLNSKPLIKIYQ